MTSIANTHSNVVAAENGARQRLDIFLCVATCALFVIALHLPWVSNLPLAGTEGHRALTAHQMVESRQWLIPKLYGRVYLRKPPLHYWMIAATELVTGRGTEFIWRMPSTVFSGLTAGTVALFGYRWFGRSAGWVSGLSFASLIALWAQSRTADIDSTNTFFCTAAALLLLEMIFGNVRSIGRTMACGIFIGATLLTKGPAGLPPIAAVLLAAMALRIRPLWTWPVVVSLAGGAALFAIYCLATVWNIHAQHLPLDWSGFNEGTGNLVPSTLSRAGLALTLPFILLIYSLPVSLFLPFALWLSHRTPPQLRDITDSYRQAIYVTILLAWAICVLSGMVNPRYGYVTLPLLCPLAGGCVTAVKRSATIAALNNRHRKAIVVVATASSVTLCAASVAISAINSRNAVFQPAMIATILAAIVCGWATSRCCRRGRLGSAALGWVALLLIFSLPFGVMTNITRANRSGFAAAQAIRSIVPPNAPVTMGAMLRYQPELFYYAGLNAHADSETIPAAAGISGEIWLVLDKSEYELYQTEARDRFISTTRFESNKKTGYLAHLRAAQPR